MRIESFLTDATRRYAGKTALVSQGERLDYATLERLSDRLAAHWQAKGLTRGDRVVLLLDNSWQAAMALFACFKAGAIAVPITPLTKAERLATILGDCTPTILVTQARLAGLVETVGPVPLGTLPPPPICSIRSSSRTLPRCRTAASIPISPCCSTPLAPAANPRR